MNLTESLLKALKDCGASEIFGIPGDFALPYFRVIEDSQILPLFTLSHEPAVGFAADAAARFSSGLGVAAVTYGAGALNMVNAVAQAFAEKSPVVVISGAPGKIESARGLLLHHQAKTLDSQYRIYQEITCDQAVLDDAARAPEQIARVLQSCLRESRPVYIEIPRDMAQVGCHPVVFPEVDPVDQDAVDACADSLLERLTAACQPLLMAGVEVRRFGLEEKVKELAERLAIPVVTSFMGSGLLVGSERLTGTYLGAAGDPDLSHAVETSDCLLLLGVLLSDTNFGVSAGKIDMRRAVHVEGNQVRIGYSLYPHIPLEALLDTLLQRLKESASLAADRPKAQIQSYPSLEDDHQDLSPDDIAHSLNDLIEKNGPVPLASDIGDCFFTLMGIRPTPIAAPGYYASMGFGVPAGLGIQAASGQRPIILVGDGAFQMTGMELGHCVRHGLDPIVLLYNNSTWGMLAAFDADANYNQLGHSWNYAALADALGGEGCQVRTRHELKQALDNAWQKRGRFQLIEIIIPPQKLSSTLTRYVHTIKQMQRKVD